MFECNVCKNKFTTKASLQYHIQHNACKLVAKVECPNCGKKFTLKSNMVYHMKKSCKYKDNNIDDNVNTNDNDNTNDDNNDDINNDINNDINDGIMIKNIDDKKKMYEKISELQNEIEKLKKENIKLKKNINNNLTNNLNNNVSNNGIINNLNNNGIINNGTMNISLVGYGKEDIGKIDKKEIINIFKNGFHSTLKLTDTIHFNPKYPEFHNVYISSMKNKYAMIYDGTDWTLVMKNELIDRIYDDKKDYIEENFDKFIDSLTVSQKNALKRWLDTEDNAKIKRIKEQIKLLLYNKRNIPINNKLIKNDNDIKLDNNDNNDSKFNNKKRIVLKNNVI